MKLVEKKMNLFTVPDKYYFAHCISADYALGAGIAVEFQKRFHLKEKLNDCGTHIYPDCIKIDRVFNLVTKNKYWNKPTLLSLQHSLEYMKKYIKTNNKYAKISYTQMLGGTTVPEWYCGLTHTDEYCHGNDYEEDD